MSELKEVNNWELCDENRNLINFRTIYFRWELLSSHRKCIVLKFIKFLKVDSSFTLFLKMFQSRLHPSSVNGSAFTISRHKRFNDFFAHSLNNYIPKKNFLPNTDSTIFYHQTCRKVKWQPLLLKQKVVAYLRIWKMNSN